MIIFSFWWIKTLFCDFHRGKPLISRGALFRVTGGYPVKSPETDSKNFTYILLGAAFFISPNNVMNPEDPVGETHEPKVDQMTVFEGSKGRLWEDFFEE